MTHRVLCLLVCGSLLLRADWSTFGGDAQRSGWNKSEDTFNTTNVKGLALEWKVTLENEPRELNALTPPILAEGVITPHGFKEYVVVAGSSDVLYAVDAESGKIVWKKQFEVDNSKRPKTSFWLCPNSLNATPIIRSRVAYAIASDGKVHAVNVNNGEDVFPPTQFTPPFSKNWSLNFRDGFLVTTSSQGCGGTHSGVWTMDIKSADRKVTFVPATTDGGAGVWGRGGVAIGKERAFAETGDGTYDAAKGDFSDSVLGVSLADSKIADYYTPANRTYITRKDLDMGNMSPVVFDYKGRELVAAAGKEGVIYLLDGGSLGGPDHRTPLFRSPLYTNEDVDFAGRGFWGAFATWQDPKGDRWLYAPASGPVTSKAPAFAMKNGDAPDGSIMAFKVVDKDGSPALEPMWMSRNMNIPEPPVVTNGVVFAISNGEFARQAKDSGGLYSSKERVASHTGNTVLYAFDAATGKELFSSGNTMPSFTHFSGIAVASGHILVTTYDNTLYSFGLKQ